jgi:hypothetical protein
MFIDGEYQPPGLCSWEALIAPIMGMFSEAAPLAAVEGPLLESGAFLSPAAAAAGAGGSMMPFVNALGTVGNAVSGVTKGISGIENMANSPSPESSSGAKSFSQPNISPADYKNQETQYYQQMLAGLGMGTEGNQLPQGIQDAINKQASQL